MKNLLFFLLIALAACQKQANLPVTSNPILIVDKNAPPLDEMKAEFARVTMERGKPTEPKPRGPKPKPPTDTTTTPPTTPPTVPQGATLIFYDINGHTSINNAWATYYGTGSLYSPPANVTDAQIDEIIPLVQEAFVLYNVVYTKDENYFMAYQGKKTRVILTSSDVTFPGATGSAWVGSNTEPYSEVMIYPENMLNLTSYIHKIVTHELGHAFGLWHQALFEDPTDCYRRTVHYREGYKMGVHWSTPGIWGYGTSLDCRTFQDDNAVLAANVGLR